MDSATDKRPWWSRTKTEAGIAAFETWRRLRRTQTSDYRQRQLLRHYRLYSNRWIQGLSAGQHAPTVDLPKDRLTLNVVQSVVDTAHTLISTNKPKVMFTTYGADYAAQRRAEMLPHFVDGQFDQVGMYDLDSEVCKDAQIAGWGGVKIYDEDEDIKVERILPEEIEVDDIEAKYRRPRSVYHTKEWNRDHLQARCKADPDPRIRSKAAFIKDAELVDNYFRPSYIGDMVTVIEGWHLPSRPGATDGLHTIAVSNATLLCEPWDESDFPFVIWRWNPDSRGFWGQGQPEMLRGVQVQVNQLLQKIQRHMKKASSKVFVPQASNITSRRTNEEWEEIPFAGDRPPVFATIQAIAPQYFEHLEYLYRKAYELTGVTQLAAEGLKPAGLDSGKALRAYNDLQTRRFLNIGQSWERFHVDVAKKLIGLAKRIDAREGKSYKVQAEVGGNLVHIRWSDVSLEEDSYRMRAQPAGLLPDQPAGLYQAVVELADTVPEIGPYKLDLLEGVPDLKRVVRRLQAPLHVAERIIERILDGGIYTPPEPYFDLQLCVQQMQLAYQEALVAVVEEGKLELFRRWIDEALARLAPPAPPGMEPGMAAGMGPGAGAMPPGAAPAGPAGMPGVPTGLDSQVAARMLPAQVPQALQ